MKIDAIVSHSDEIIQFFVLANYIKRKRESSNGFYRKIHMNPFDYLNQNFFLFFYSLTQHSLEHCSKKYKSETHTHTRHAFVQCEKRMSIKCFHFEQLASVSNEELKYESAACMLLKIEWTTVVGNHTIGHHVLLQKFNTIHTLHTNIMPIVAHTHCSCLKIDDKWKGKKKKKNNVSKRTFFPFFHY